MVLLNIKGMEQLHIVLVHDDAGVLLVDRFIVKAALDGSIIEKYFHFVYRLSAQ